MRYGLLLGSLLVPAVVQPAQGLIPTEPARSEYVAQVWDTDRGLPDYAAKGFAQTPDGFLWVATFEGLVRFDGARFEVINNLTRPDFPGKATSAVLLDRKNQIWVASDNGVACLRAGRWQTYNGAGGAPVKFAASMAEDRDGGIVATSGKRLFRLAHDHFEEVALPAGTEAPIVFRDFDGGVWVHDPKYLAKVQTGGIQAVPIPPDLAAGGIQGAGPGAGGLWVAGAATVRQFHDGEWSKPIPAPGGFRFTRVTSLREDSDGNLWAGDFSAGLLQFRRDGHVLRFSREDGLPNAAIRALFEDREKNMWVGTHGGGMVRMRPRVARLFDEDAGLGETMLDTVVEMAAGGLLVATYGGGAVEFDEAGSRFRVPTIHRGLRLLGERSVITSALEDGDGSVVVGVIGKGMLRIRGDRVEPAAPDALAKIGPKALFRDSRGTLWIGADNGLTSYRPGHYEHYLPESGLPSGPVGAIAEDAHGGIWVGGQGGLFRFAGGRFEKFLPEGAREYSPITSLYGGRDGGLWIGTELGLDRLRNSRLTSYGPAHGLPIARITGIVEDDLGRLWIPTFQHGLFCVSIDSFDAVDAHRTARLDLIWLRKEDGLGTNQFRAGYQPVAWKGKDGRLWFATLKGLAMADPQRVRRNPVLPPVLIEAVEVNGRRVAADGSRTGVTDLPAGSRRLQFFYTAPSFIAPEKVRFQYQLEGLDANWREADERSAGFAGVRPGDYVFRVKAANSDGVWTAVPAEMRVRVAYYVWETWWFRVCGLVCLAAISAAAVYTTQQKKLLRGIEQLRKEQELRRDVERLQSVLKVSEERFAKAFNATPNPLSISTMGDGRFVEVNASFLEATGLRREEVIGRTRAEVGVWDEASLPGELRAALDSGARVHGADVRMHDRSGRLHHLIVSTDVIELGGVRHLLAVSNDITDRKLLEEQLGQAQKLESIGRLAGGVAHDFNNLLTVINGYSELLLLTHAELSELSKERVKLIRQAGERARDLTQQLLAFGRKQAIRPQSLDLNGLVRETETMLRRLLPETIDVVIRLDPALGLVTADPGQMHQVLLNLALNARDAMPWGGRLTMETANVDVDAYYCSTHPDAGPGPCVLLAVTDTGIGMDESVRMHMFEPFFTTKGPGAGTGLGLASAYGIIRQSKGWISVLSEPGKGSAFQIYLPRLYDAGSRNGAAIQAAATLLGSETILLVEDQEDVRGYVREVLRSHGYRVLEAATGAAALELAAAQEGAIHLLLTDVVMPGMTGRELCERLIAAGCPMRVLYMSGYNENVIAPQGDRGAGADFLSKPLTPDGLAAKVREILDRPP